MASADHPHAFHRDISDRNDMLGSDIILHGERGETISMNEKRAETGIANSERLKKLDYYQSTILPDHQPPI